MESVISKKTISKNISTTVIQILLNSIVYYWLYKYLTINLGIELLGVMSLILALSSIANISNLGLASSIVQFAATFSVRNEKKQIDVLVKTSFLFLLLFFTLFGILTYGIIFFFRYSIISQPYTDLAINMLPYSLLSLLLLTLSGVFTSILEGFQKHFLKNYIYIISSFFFVALIYLLVPKYGLIGVAYSQVIQSGIILILGVIFSKKVVPEINLLRWGWDKKMFQQIFNYGIKFQFISLASILFEPITKFFIGKFSNLSTLGYYEMASRLVVQVRSLIVSANQVLLPVIVNLNEKNKPGAHTFFKQIFQINFSIASIVMSCLVCLLPCISIVWLNQFNWMFIGMSFFLIVGYTFNIFMAPVYFALLAEARLRLLIISHLIMGSINLGIGFILGIIVGGFGPIIAWVLALIGVAFYMIAAYAKDQKIALYELLKVKQVLYFLIMILIGSIPIIFNQFFVQFVSLNTNIILSVIILIFLSMLFYTTNTAIKLLVKKYIFK